MTSVSQVFGYRLALAGALLACSCQHDGGAIFDDSKVPGPGMGGTATAGSQATAGEGSAGDDANGGASDSGGTAAGGSAGVAGGGAGATAGGAAAGSAGKPGAGEGGTAGSSGGTAGGGTNGTGGTKPDPEPVTIEIHDFDDAYVASCLQTSNFGDAETLNVDANAGCTYHALISPSLAELPEGALVSAAKLVLYCQNGGGELGVTYATEAWNEDTVRWTTRPESGDAIGSAACAEQATVSIDLSAAVKAWASGQRPAHGIYLRGQDQNGTDFVSSEGDVADRRPVLTITYTLPHK
jgi:hypothetical protein